MKEQWKIICEEGVHQNRYLVSNLGRLKSRTRDTKGRFMKPNKLKGGYLQIELRGQNKRNMFLVHRLVAKYFLSTWDENLTVNHLDENPQNNQVSNLEMCTQAENNAYGSHNERCVAWLTNPEKVESMSKQRTKTLFERYGTDVTNNTECWLLNEITGHALYFSSLSSASRYFGLKKTVHTKSLKGYLIIRDFDEAIMTRPKINPTRVNCINEEHLVATHIVTGETIIFLSRKEARANGISHINQCLDGRKECSKFYKISTAS